MRILLSIFLLVPIFTSLSAGADVGGEISGFEIRNNDNVFNFGLALPVLTKSQMLNFNLDMFLSAEMDSITALGQSIEIPSNLSIPEQRERYFFSIRFNKPSYLLPWTQNSELQGVGALEGQFAFKEVIDKVRGGAPLFSLINDFNFQSFSLKSFNGSIVDLLVGDTKHTHIMRLNGLTADNSPYLTLAIALDSEDKNFFFPIDLKQLSLSNSPSLKVTLNSHAALAIVPKELFTAPTLKNVNLEVPFSMIWKAKVENTALPMLTNLIDFNQTSLSVNSSEISKDHNIIGYKLSLLNSSNETIFESTILSALPENIAIPTDLNYSKIRLDVFASDGKSSVQSKNELTEATDYVARYEKNI